MNVIQIISADAELFVKQEAHLYHRMFEGWGWKSSLYVVDPDQPDKKPGIKADDLIIYHCDSYLTPTASFENHSTERTIVVLQDYIQVDYFHLYEDAERKKLISIDRWLTELIPNAAVSIGHSDAACRILELKNARRIRKIPALADYSGFDLKPDRFQSILLNNEKRKIMFSGEVDAGSRVEDLIKTFWYFCDYEKTGSTEWQLLINGRHDRCVGYMQKISLVFKHYEIPQNWVLMASDLNQEEINAFYDNADLYLTFDESDFSGTGILQAIHNGIPVIAFSQGAGGDVLTGTEMLFDEPVHSAVAEGIEMTVTDDIWRKKILEAQRKILKRFDHSAVEFVLRSVFSRFEQ